MSVLLQRCLKRSNLVEQLVEQWQVEHEEAMLARDVEELCGEAIELCRLCGHTWQELKTLLFANCITDTEATGRVALEGFENAGRAVRRVVRLLDDAIARGHGIGGAQELRRGMNDVHDIKERLLKKWPFIDHQMVERALAAYGRGEFQTAESLLHACAAC
jgi:hypothetical protein